MQNNYSEEGKKSVEGELEQTQKLKSCTGKDLDFIVHDAPNIFLMNCFIIGFQTWSQNNLKNETEQKNSPRPPQLLSISLLK